MAFLKKNLLIIILVVAVIGAGYYFLFLRGVDSGATVTAEDGPASSAEETFINLSTQLEPIHFDLSILSDPRFTALQDIHTSIIPETLGRTDPFGPLSGVAPAK